jgi:hypothetical protein
LWNSPTSFRCNKFYRFIYVKLTESTSRLRNNKRTRAGSHVLMPIWPKNNGGGSATRQREKNGAIGCRFRLGPTMTTTPDSRTGARSPAVGLTQWASMLSRGRLRTQRHHLAHGSAAQPRVLCASPPRLHSGESHRRPASSQSPPPANLGKRHKD